ncbi:MAG: hypothetical protein K2P58_10330 [Hyphomonadaceae bacterium]|nr:hypothetical protein [Hyphomonadaceae bacterium]
MRTSLFGALALIGLLYSAPDAQAQTRYPLACRAGGNMGVNIAPQASGGGTEIVISYDRATRTTGLPAGSCSWFDRTLNDREPRSMRIVVRARMSVDLRPRPGDHAGDRGDVFVFAGSGADVALAETIVRVLKSGGAFTVQAYNPGRAPMVAESFRETAPR